MPIADFTSLGDCDALHLFRTGTGFTSSGDGTEITGSTDDSATGVDATMSGGASAARPVHADTTPGSTLGPAAFHATSARLGFDLQRNYSGSTTWTYATAVWLTSIASFQNIFSSSGGAEQGSLYTNSGEVNYQETGNEATGTSLTTGELYTIAHYSNATRYRTVIRDSTGSVVLDHTYAATPAGGPSIFDTNAYGGGSPGITGYVWAHVLFTADKIADDAAIHTALREEALGASGSTIDGTVSESGLLGSDSATGVLTHVSTVAESGLLGLDAALGTVTGVVDGAVAESGLLGADTATGTFTRVGTVAESGLLGTDAVSGNVSGVLGAAVVESGLLGTDEAQGAPTLDDAFAGSGDLTGWYPYQPSALPAVSQTGGRYLAELDDNTGDVTLWFNGSTGRGDFRFIAPGTEFIVTNIGIGQDAANTQTAPSTTGDPVIFCGLHFNADLNSPTTFSAHVVVGHRGGVFRTIETKVTTAGTSAVADEGFNALGATDTRCDLRFVLDGSGNLSAWYRAANSSDPWVAISWPGATPVFASGCYAGIITYAAGITGVPFVGTADAIAEISSVEATVADSGLLGVDAVTGDVPNRAQVAETGLLGSDAVASNRTIAGTAAETGLLGTDAAASTVIGVADATVAESGLLGVDVAIGNIVGPTLAAVAESGLLGSDAIAGVATGVVNGSLVEGGLLGSDAATASFVRTAAVASSGLLGVDSLVGTIPSAISGTIAESGLLGVDAVLSGYTVAAVRATATIQLSARVRHMTDPKVRVPQGATLYSEVVFEYFNTTTGKWVAADADSVAVTVKVRGDLDDVTLEDLTADIIDHAEPGRYGILVDTSTRAKDPWVLRWHANGVGPGSDNDADDYVYFTVYGEI